MNSLFYFGHAFRFREMGYFVNLSEAGPDGHTALESRERGLEYTWLLGNRLIGDLSSPGFTFDISVGLGVGYRQVHQSFSDIQVYNDLFSQVKTEPWYIPARFQFSFGYLF